MAGNYPDVPAPRMAFDRDGSVGVRVSSTNTVVALTQTELQQINNETDGEISNSDVGARYAIIFPQLRDVLGYFVYSGLASFFKDISTSSNTTNGLDGTWTIQSASPTASTSSAPGYRNNIQTVSWTGINAVRFRTVDTGWNWGMHLYGAIVAGQTPDRLRMWHPTLDEPLDDPTSADGAYFDWGDVQRNTTSDKTFRIKNNSTTLTANSITISQETLTDTTPTVNSQFTFSDGGAFAASINIGNLAPAAISPVITKRFTRPSNATLALWASRTIANPGSWT